MASLAIEQKLQEYGYQQGNVPQAASNQINLGGFAVSFEDLLQRVGARLEHAFSAADKQGGIAVAAETPKAGNDTRDYAKGRDGAGERSDQRANDDASEHGRTTAADARDNGAERSADAPRSDNAADNGAQHADNSERDGQGARDNSETGDRGNADDGGKGDSSAEAAGNGSGDGNSNEKSAGNGNEGGAAENAAGQNTTQQGPGVTQAAAIYAAGLVGNNGGDAANTGQAEAQAKAQAGVNAGDNTIVQAAAAKTQKNGPNNHNGAQRGQQNQAKTAAGAEQKTTDGEQKSATAGTQNQAQQMSRIIGSDTRANINVNVTNEQTQLTSKPTFTVTNGSVLTPDPGNGQGNASNAGTGQQQGQTAGQAQQAQLAAQQQAQAAQQANIQNGPQGAQGAAGQAGSGAASAVQGTGGGAQHAGGNESMNNVTQNANAAQQTQQTQQTREAQPQQHAQHAQRGNLPGSAVTEQISVKITKALQAGTDKISIQLKPAELGRVDVKMEMTHDGRVMTVVTAEKQDTLDLLRRDSSELQKALADAGLNSGDMEFNLKGQEQQTADAQGDGKDAPASAEVEADEAAPVDDNDGVMSAWESGIFANGRLDMRA